MADNRDVLINELYKKTFGKEYSKYGDIMERYDKATGTLYCHTDNSEVRYTSDQIQGAEKYLREFVEKEQNTGRETYYKIAMCAIKLMQEEQQG